jgi:outer membrane receptor for ferrienterochelin and colicin
MRILIFITLNILLTISVFSQNVLTGHIRGLDDKGDESPVPGAMIGWLGTPKGTTTDSAGAFRLPYYGNATTVVIWHAAFLSDTIKVGKQRTLDVVLKPAVRELEGVSVVGKRPETVVDFLRTQPLQIITEKELFKAACCNLSESFETNASVDVSFTDAITGARQIEMLGLSGIYTSVTLENMPFIRGLPSSVGLTFIPGPWIKSINVSKGIGSVINGFESITGQIDIDLQKPEDNDDKPFFLNFFGSQEQRFEGNLNARSALSDNLASMTFLHASSQQHHLDRNGDRFVDMPVFTATDLSQRFHYSSGEGWDAFLGVQLVNDKRDGGTLMGGTAPASMNPAAETSFDYGTRVRFLRIEGKTGRFDPDNPAESFGVQWSLSRYHNTSRYGPRSYDGTEQSGYLNVIVQSTLGSMLHMFKAGVSFLFDEFDETFASNAFGRTERTPGVFFEYTYKNETDFSMVAGIRVDRHNAYGTMITPRLHVRYAPDDNWVFRLVGGKGYRTANILTEHAAIFASSRTFSIQRSGNFGFGLEQESAWNYGANVTRYFRANNREGTISVDVHRTQFNTQVIADLDSKPREVQFLSLRDGSYANSAQIELNLHALKGLDVRLAYRFLDVQQKVNGSWRQAAFTARHRSLLNVAYTTPVENPGDHQTTIDVTVQWFGSKRIPETSTNPEGLRARAFSPDFATVNMQASRSIFAGLELYLGIENLFDFRQTDPIIDPGNPSGPYFDASLVWGPISGRAAYGGMRFRF